MQILSKSNIGFCKSALVQKSFSLISHVTVRFGREIQPIGKECESVRNKFGKRAEMERFYLEKVHSVDGEIARHFGVDRFSDVRFGDGQAGEEFIVLEYFHVARNEVP